MFGPGITCIAALATTTTYACVFAEELSTSQAQQTQVPLTLWTPATSSVYAFKNIRGALVEIGILQNPKHENLCPIHNQDYVGEDLWCQVPIYAYDAHLKTPISAYQLPYENQPWTQTGWVQITNCSPYTFIPNFDEQAFENPVTLPSPANHEQLDTSALDVPLFEHSVTQNCPVYQINARGRLELDTSSALNKTEHVFGIDGDYAQISRNDQMLYVSKYCFEDSASWQMYPWPSSKDKNPCKEK